MQDLLRHMQSENDTDTLARVFVTYFPEIQAMLVVLGTFQSLIEITLIVQQLSAVNAKASPSNLVKYRKATTLSKCQQVYATSFRVSKFFCRIL